MVVSEVRSDRNQPVAHKLPQVSDRSRITRRSVGDDTVICKQPLGPDAEQRVWHETTMLKRLRGVHGVAQLAQAPAEPGTILLQDAGTANLADSAKPLDDDALIELAMQLARAVSDMHHRGVIHRDITPANIVMGHDGVPCLVDFALATSLAEIRPEFTHHTEIVGTLAYLAPEQTGRTSRAVDQRADLYALGATLFELATGEPPFGSGDPLRLTHDHLARVPTSPHQLNSDVGELLSAIILHLLEKEPDRRYQTADGLLYDLHRLRDDQPDPAAPPPPVGEHDFPVRLAPPSRLVGRDDDLAALTAAFDDAMAGRCGAVLISGAAGVGKTALADELRPVVTGSDGWFVTGKSDQYRRDLEFDAVHQALRALGRLVLAEPDEVLAQFRQRTLVALGANAGLLAATLPEFAALLAVAPDPGNPLTARTRTERAEVEVLRAVAARTRPLVVFLDDLQWAGRTVLGVIDLVLGDEPVEGLLLVGAYRRDDLDAAHPLAQMLSRWEQRAGVRRVDLKNLPASTAGTMVAEMLRVDHATAAALAALIEPHTRGNPFEVVELLNALRRDGLLTASANGWRWDDPAVRTRLGQTEVGELVSARLEDLPAVSRAIVEKMACLGGRSELRTLEKATGEPRFVVEQMLAPVLEDGLLVVEPGSHEAVRFRHDRTRDIVLAGLGPRRREALQLEMARRLARVPEIFAVAAEQYLPVIDAVIDPTERRDVVELLGRAADQATLTGDYSLVDALLSAALRLVADDETATLARLHTGRHAALYSLGRFDDADAEYRVVARLCASPTERTDATVVQVLSLTQRGRLTDAIGFGLESLRELGITVPDPDRLAGELDDQFDHLYRWLDRTDAAADLARPAINDPTLIATTRIIDAILPCIYFVGDHATNAWLSLEALRIWVEHGPGPTLVGPASAAAFATVTQRADYAAAYRAARRILAFGEARGYEPDTSHARFLFSVLCSWFEPVEHCVNSGQLAREGLIAGGDLANAGYAWQSIVAGLLDCVPSLDIFVTEVDAGLAFGRRIGGEQTTQCFESYRWLAGQLRGERPAGADEVPIEKYAGNPQTLFFAHITRAVHAAVTDDVDRLERHTAEAMPLLATVLGHYVGAIAHVLRALAVARRARETDGDERSALLSELDQATRWLAARAADAPANFLHLLRLVEAERAWAAGDFKAAIRAFDAARREASQRQRPWHRALIAERAARLHLAHDVPHAGYNLLAEARSHYLSWGALAKVDQLDWAYPVLRASTGVGTDQRDRPAGGIQHESAVTTGMIDMLGIVSASQALSSETDIGGLHARVARVLSAMTGATDVHLFLWNDDRQDWVMPASGMDAAAPTSVLQYVARTGEPLVVADAVRDDRFARDPHFADAECCSVLALPVVSRGVVSAMLLLENRLMRGAFTAERLDGVKLIAGQLAVSLDNARIYAEFRRIADDQAALRRVATLVARGVQPSEVFAAVTDELRRCLHEVTAGLWRYETTGEITLLAASAAPELRAKWPIGTRTKLAGDNLASNVLRTGLPARMDSYETAEGDIAARVRELGNSAAVGVPVIVDGRLWGMAAVSSPNPGPMPADTEKRMSDFAELVGTAISNSVTRAELQASRDDLKASRARIVAAADDARRRLERDLHDGAQQRLVSLGLELRAAQAGLGPEQQELNEQMSCIVSGLSAVSAELQQLSRGIHPAILSKGGLAPALKALARQCPIPVSLDVCVDGRLPDSVEVGAYYVAAEALTNAAKHAQASEVTVQAGTDDQYLHLVIRDNGVGGADAGRGSGLVGLKDRVEALGGRLVVSSPVGGGTSLTVLAPLQQP